VAVAYIQEFDVDPGGDRSTTNYDAVASRLGNVQPEGLLIHTAGFDEEAGVFRIFDVWESREEAQGFIDDQLMPIVNELISTAPEGTAPPPRREGFYELHDVIRA
jgi:hypothetical protein